MLTRATGLRLRRPRLGQLLIALSVGVVAVSAVASFAIDRPGTTELAAPSSRESSGSDGILVHVTGAVNTPGVVSLAVGARVLDAIAAAGGLGPNADQSAI
ncbi:MAG: SLBB domain-containing protein, partial [Agromyces sp.]